MVNPNMEWYLLPGMSDVPEIDVTLVDQPERGVIGLGEPPAISTAAAIANAVANATGVRMRSLPLTPDTVLAALEQERREGRCEGLCLRQRRRTRRKRSPRSAPSAESSCRSPAAQDLLALMKDYIAQPERLVNVKNLDTTIAQTPDGGLQHRRGGHDRGPRRRMPTCARLYPALVQAADGSRHAADPQRGTVGGNLNQRPRCWYFRNEEFDCLKKGGIALLRGGRREPVPRHLRRRAVPHRPSVEPGGAGGRARRDVPRRRPGGRARGGGRGLLPDADDRNMFGETCSRPTSC